jgi:ribosomal-protein-alanine N-acetyltransferase
MAILDRMNFFSRWPAIRALRTRVGGMLPGIAGQRKLHMPGLETKRLLLRPFVPDDLRDVIDWEESPGAHDREAQAQEFLEYCFHEYRERGIGPWGMQMKETGAVVGNCGFPHIQFRKHCGEINYYVSPRYRGQGLAPEAVNVLLKLGFSEIGLQQIQARCDLDNLSSERVMRKVGMKFERLEESSAPSKETRHEQQLYMIRKEDFAWASTEGN